MKDPMAKRIIISIIILTLLGIIGYEITSLIDSVNERKGMAIASVAEPLILQENSIQISDNKKDKEKKNEDKNVENNENKKEEKESEHTASSPYYIKVNRIANTITVYEKDKKGKYTVPIRAMICTTGYATPYGTYPLLAKGNWWPLYGDVYGQYASHIVGNILFHSVPYLERNNKASIEWWEYDKLRNNGVYGMCKTNSCRCKMDF